MPQFPSTSWTLVVAAGGDASEPDVRQALGRLCEAYWFPLYAYARRRGYSPDDAADHTQSYFARLIEKDYLRELDTDRGRFRCFLLASFRHHLSNELDRVHALKRGGSVLITPISVETAEGIYDLDPRDSSTPERVFEKKWAVTLLERATSRLRQEFDKKGKSGLFDAFKIYLSGENYPGQYALHATEFGMTENAVKVEVHRLRRRFQKAVREEIADTVSGPEDVEHELRFLIKVLQEL